MQQGVLPRIVRFIDLNTEANLASFLSGMNLLATALVVAVLACSCGPAGARRRRWALLALIFAYLAMDEMASVHERVGRHLAAFLGVEETIGAFVWVVPFGLGAALIAGAYAPFWWAFAPRYRRLLGAAAALFLGGGLLLEAVGSQLVDRPFLYALQYIAEEALEMIGVILFLYTFLLYWRNEVGRVDLRILPPGEPRTAGS